MRKMEGSMIINMKKLFNTNRKKVIRVGETFVSLQPYTLGEIKPLEISLSVYDKLYHKVIPYGYNYDPKSKTMYLPKNVNIEKIEKAYIENEVTKKIVSSNKGKHITFNMTATPRNEMQVNAIDFLLGRGKHIANQYSARQMLSLDTGGGKTFCTLASISYMNRRAAIILPDLALIDRWLDEIYKITDLKEDEIFIVKGTKSVKHLYSYGTDAKIILVSHRTISKFGDKFGWDKVYDLFKVMNIGVKVYDEAHKEFKNIVRIDMHSNISKTIYLTATAARSEMKENKIYETVFSKMPKMVITNSQRDQNHINTVIYKYDSNPSLKDQSVCKTIKGFSANAFMKYNLNKGNMYFLKSVEFFMNTVLSNGKDGRILIMVGLIDMIYYLENHLKLIYPNYADDIGIYCSKVSKKEKDMTLKNKRIIVTTFKSLGTGVDIDNLKYICMAEPYSSKVTASQCSGRLRTSGWYFELVDVGFSDCTRQYENREKTLIRKSNKYKIVKG